MPPLPVLGRAETVRSGERLGWSVARRWGSYIITTKPGETATLSVPNHPEVAKGILRRLINAAGLTVAEFCATFVTC